MAVIAWTRRSAATSLAVLAVVGGAALAGCGAGQQAQTAEQRPTVDGTSGQLGDIVLRDVALEYPPNGLYVKGGDARLRMVVVNEGVQSDQLIEVRSNVAARVTLADAGTPGATVSAEPTGSDTASAEPTGEPTGTASGTPTGTSEPDTPSGSAGGTAAPSASQTGSPVATGSQTPTPSTVPTTTAPPAATRIAIPANGLVSFRGDGPTVQLVGLTRPLRATQEIEVTLVFANAGQVTLTVNVAVPDGEVSPAPTVTSAEGGESEG